MLLYIGAVPFAGGGGPQSNHTSLYYRKRSLAEAEET